MKDIKKALKNKELTIGSWITMPSSIIVEMMCKSGFDWLAVDLEHSAISIESLQDMIRIIDLHDVFPLVRLTSNDPDQIKRIMDAGSKGIIVPMVKSANEVKRAVDSMYYPIKGKRSVGLARAQGYGRDLESYIKELEEKCVLIVQIEHIDAVNDLEEIFSINELDGYFIGPIDLSASMGLPGQIHHPEVKKVIDHIIKKGKEINIPGGQHIIEPDLKLLAAAEKAGTNFIGYSLDIKIFDKALSEFQGRD